MLRHAIVFVGIQVVIEAIKISADLKGISKLIEHIQQRGAKYDIQQDRSIENSNNRNVAISSRELDKLITEVANSIYEANKYNGLSGNLEGSKKHKFRNVKDRNLQLLPYEIQRLQKNPSKTVVSNHEENSIDSDVEDAQSSNDNDKLYLVLNPRANLNKNDFKEITGLLTHFLLGSVASKQMYSKHDDTRIKNEPRYKGFALAKGTLWRRRNMRRDSDELQDSLEDFKPKRGRNDYARAGGRTPIPYIGHRDIYERE